MKFSVSMYSYMQKIRSGEATPFEPVSYTHLTLPTTPYV